MKITIIEKRNEFENDNLTIGELSSVRGGEMFCIKYIDTDVPGSDTCGVFTGGSGVCIKKLVCGPY